MNKKTDRTEMITARITKEQKEKIGKLISRMKITESEAIREGINMLLNIQSYRDNLDEILQIIARLVDAKLDPFIKTQRALNAKYTRSASINTYLIADMLERILADNYKEEFEYAIKIARQKANLYVNKKIPEGMNDEDILNYYKIGDIYRNE